MVNLKPSKKIQTKVVVIFVFSISLLLFFGIKVFISSLTIEQGIKDQHGLSNGLNAQQISSLAKNFDSLTAFSLLYLSVGASIFIGLMFNLIYSINPSLKRLSYAVQQISKGNYAFRLKLRNKNEFGDISDTLNLALDKVFSEQEELRKQKKQVDQIVIERTKQLRHERTKFLLSIKSLPVGFMLVRGDGSINLMNPKMGSFLNFKSLDLEDFKHNLEVIANLIQTLTSHVGEVIKTQEPLSIKYTSETGQHLQVAYSPLLDNQTEPASVVIVVEDVTDQVNIEHTKDEFMTIASHELRTPLSIIKGNADLLRTLYKGLLEDQQFSKILKGIESSSTRLSGIVNELLDAAMLEQGGITIKPEAYNILDSIVFIAADMAQLAAEKGLYIHYDEAKFESAPQVYAEPRRIEQILYNLIGNSFKFTKSGGVTLDYQISNNKL